MRHSRQYPPKIIIILTTALAFTCILYLVIFSSRINEVVVKIQINSETPGVFAIYWPSLRGNYTNNQHNETKYSAGKSTVELLLPSFSGRHALRLDPIGEIGKVQLLGLSVERFGRKYSLLPKEIENRVVSTVSSRLQLTPEALTVISESRDPQLFLSDIPLPLPAKTTMLLMPLAFCLLLFMLCRNGLRLWQNQPTPPAYHFLIGMSALNVVCREYQLHVAISFTACFLLILAAQQVIIGNIRAKVPRSSRQLLQPSLICGLFLFITLTPFFIALDPNSDFLGILREQVKAIRPETNSSLNKILAARLKEIEDGFTHYFPFRDELIHLNANTKVKILGYSPTPKAILGKNGMFFEGYGDRRVEQDVTAFFDNVTDDMGLIPFTDQELEAWRTCLEERYYWLKEKGIDYIFALAPSKALIYPENLPDKILEVKQALGKPTRYDQLVRYMRDHSSMPFVDLSKPLRDAKMEAEQRGTLARTPIYYRTDFHWTYYGAYIAYRAIIDAVNQFYPNYNLVATPLNQFRIEVNPHWGHYRFLYSIGLDPIQNQDDTYLTFMPNKNSILAGVANFGNIGINDHSIPEEVYNNYDGYKIGKRELDNGRGDLDTIFVVGDSFSEKYFGYFSSHAKKTINFRTIYSFFPTPYLEYKPNLVIQEVLNMYLLRPPPTNPEQVREARIHALAKYSPENNGSK